MPATREVTLGAAGVNKRKPLAFHQVFCRASTMQAPPAPRPAALSATQPSRAEIGRLRDSDEVKAMIASHFAQQLLALTTNPRQAIAIDELPLARIKRIMKQDSCDPHPRQVSADTVPFMAYMVQLFIGAMTTLAWKLSTQHAKRNTLQVKDLKLVVFSSSQHDFLIDVLDLFDEEQRKKIAESSPSLGGQEFDNWGAKATQATFAQRFAHQMADELAL